MSASFRILISITCGALLSQRAAAQAASAPPSPAAPAHSHTPAPPSHAHGTVTLDQFVTSASPLPRNQVDLAQATTVLGGRSLLLKQQPTLGETLAAETGMSATSFGPGASRPIIRGLGGDRIRLLENSVGTIDASVISPDHAVAIEPLLVDRIEIMRGPAALLYGGNAVGGVVNVITHRIETDLPTAQIRGGGELRFSSAANELARGGVVDVALLQAPGHALVAHVDAFRRSAADMRIPGFAESARIRAEEIEHARDHGEPDPVFSAGRLPNSALNSDSAAAGLSFVSQSFHVGGSYGGLDSQYGVPGHAHETASTDASGVRIHLRQRRADLQAEWHGETGFLRGARLKFGHARYRHAEIEPDGNVGTLFRNRGHDARFELLHGDGKPWSGAAGVQSMRSAFAAAGDEAFLPPSKTRADALFAFEEVVHGAVTWQFGARFERTRISATARPARAFNEPSGSLGGIWKLDSAYSLTWSVTRTGRAPNTQELFADGPHAGTHSYEIGDATLGTEKSLGLETSLRRRVGSITGAVTLFTHRFHGYVFEEPTGLRARENDGAWVFAPVEDSAAGDEESLAVYRYVQRNARFWGAEFEAFWHLHEHVGSQLDLRFAADFTRADTATGRLPRIPATRVTVGLYWGNERWSVGADSQWVFDQTRVSAQETTTDGYALVGAHVSRTLGWGETQWELFLRASNLTDDEARPHTSFVKELAPLRGRSVAAGLRLTF